MKKSVYDKVEMAEHLYGEEWDSDEFQTALKVVLKCEIQSLLERLSETGEETVLLTASAADLCVGHLASSKALRFVNTADVGMVKNKFLNFLTGNVAQISNVACKNLTPKAAVQPPKSDTPGKTANKKTVTQNQTKPAEKRPLETGSVSQELNSQALDPKRRKTEPQVPALKGNVMTSAQTVSPSSALVTQAVTPNVNKGPAPKLKTTKVVSKSGGFTEERFSDAEFQKFLAKYKPNLPVGSEDDIDSDTEDSLALLRSLPQMSQQKPFQPSPVTSVQNSQNKVISAVNSSTDKTVKTVNQSLKNQSTQKTQLSESNKDNPSAKLDNTSVNKENRESLTTADLTEIDIVTEIKEELDPNDLEFQEAQASVKNDSEQKVSLEKEKTVPVTGCTQMKDTVGQSDKTGMPSQNRNRLESIDNLDTETLIQMTKAKHLENMSEADREIQAKLGQLSSKLSWVVEYPKEKGRPEPTGQVAVGLRPQALLASSASLMPGSVHHGAFSDNQDDAELEEMDDEDFLDDEDFDEDDLDDEDKAALKAMREAHMRKLESANMGDFREEGDMFSEGFGVSQRFHTQQFPEDYEEGEDYEGYDDFNSEEDISVNIGHLGDNRIHGTLPNLSGPSLVHGHGEGSAVSGHQPYQRTASPTSENFLMIGPIMAKCLICNKIVRKTEMRPHHETHLDDDEVEEDDELEGLEEDDDGGTFHEQQKALRGEYGEEGEYRPGEGEYRPGEGEYAGDEGEFAEEGDYSEDYEFQADEAEEDLEYTAEKFVAEKLVAEKLEHVQDTSKETKTNTCDICNKSFKSHGNMMRHRKNIHKGNTKEEVVLNSPCPVCGKSFRHVQKHIKKMHPDYSEAVSGEVCESPSDSLNCNICGELFTEEDKLKEHFKVHA